MAAIDNPDSTEAQYRISDIFPEEIARPPPLDTVEAINERQEKLRWLDETNGKKRSSLADTWQQANGRLQEERAVQDRQIHELLDKALRDTRLIADESRMALRARQEDAFDLANQRTEEEEIELTRRLVRIRRGLPAEDLKQVNHAVSASYAPQTQRQDCQPPPKRRQSGPPSQNSPAGIPPPPYQFYQATYAPQSEQHVPPSKHVPYSHFLRDINIPNGTPTPTPHHVPPPPPVGSGFTPVNVTATSGFAAVNSRPVNVEAIPSPAPNGIPNLTTPNIAVVERRPPPKSEAWEKRHHRCERYDGLGRGIWTSYGPGGTQETPTGPTVEMYLRCSHDNCMRMDWRTVHSLLVHLVRFHELPKGTVGGLWNALDRYGVPVSDIEAYERQHGDGSAGAFAEHKKPKPRLMFVPPRQPASSVSPEISSPIMQEDRVRGTPSLSVGVSVGEGYAITSGYVQEEILHSEEDSDADNLPGRSSDYNTGVGEKRKPSHDSANASERYLLPNGATMRFPTQPETHQPAPVADTPGVRNDYPDKSSTSRLHQSPEIAKQQPRKEQGMLGLGVTIDSPSRPMGHPTPSADLGKKHPRKDSVSAPGSGMKRKDAARPSLLAGHTKVQGELQDLQKVLVIDDESADEGSNSMERNRSPATRRSTNRPIKKPTKYEGAL